MFFSPRLPLPSTPLTRFSIPAHLLPCPVLGAMGGLFLDGEDSVVLEDLSKWTVEDVCSFVGSLSGCAEYTQVMGLATVKYPSLCSYYATSLAFRKQVINVKLIL